MVKVREDLTGQKFGRLTVVEQVEDYVKPGGKRQVMWACQCDCGNKLVVTGSRLKNGGTKSCGCLRKERNHEIFFVDMTGWDMRDHGIPDSRLTVVERAKDYVEPSGGRRAQWRCRCSCGNEIITRGKDLRNGKVKSCGCLKQEKLKERNDGCFIDMTGWIMKDHGVPDSRLTVIERAESHIGPNGKHHTTWKCQCECGNIIIATGNSLRSGNTKSCGCYSKEKLKKRNDDYIQERNLWETRPDIAKMLLNEEDGYKYCSGSHQKVDWICPGCKSVIHNKKINTAVRYGLSCPKCSDGISYPNKFIYNIINQIKTIYQNKHIDFDFKTEATFEWADDKFYDMYIEFNNKKIIVEMHGIQHYKETHRKGARTLKEEQDNDKLKHKLALKNGIDHYITIDCRESNIDFIKRNILNSGLLELLNISEIDIDWLECDRFSTHSRVIEACKLWNDEIRSCSKIAEIMGLSETTIYKYIKKGKAIGLVDKNDEAIQSNNTSGYKGVCWNKKSNKWYAQIRVNKKRIHLGSFTNIEDAIKARKEAEEKYWGKK